MSVVGTAVILALIIALMLKTRVARASVVIVCVLFGLVLGASPVGEGVNAALAVLGRWASDRVTELWWPCQAAGMTAPSFSAPRWSEYRCGRSSGCGWRAASVGCSC